MYFGGLSKTPTNLDFVEHCIQPIYDNKQTRSQGSTCDQCDPPFNYFALVAMIVPTRMCRVPHPLNCLATPMTIGDIVFLE